MMVVIAMLVGIYDIASLILIFALNATMILFGWIMELPQPNDDAYQLDRVLVRLLRRDRPVDRGGDLPHRRPGPAAFVYAIYASIFAFFNIFALNMALLYRRTGRWRVYLYGERVYMLLSLFAKSARAWQVFAGTLQPA